MTYVTQAISEQNPFEANIIFPLTHETLTKAEYLEYLQSLEALLAKRNTQAESLTLEFASKSTIDGLIAYFTTDSQLKFKELVLESLAEENSKDLPELIKLAASKNLQTLKLTSSAISEVTAQAILDTVINNSLAIDIELPPNHSKIQKLLDENSSNFQRKKRIGLFGEKQSPIQAASKDLPKRKRKLGSKKLGVDTEIEVQVEVVKSKQKELEEQLEHITIASDLIDRDEFIKRIQNNKFNAKISEKTKTKAANTWDRWLGNINQLVVKPEPMRLPTKITTVTRRPKDGEEFDLNAIPGKTYEICLHQPFGGSATQLYFKTTTITIDPSTTIPKVVTKVEPYQTESCSFTTKKEIDDFLNHFYPSMGTNASHYPQVDISDADWEVWQQKSLIPIPIKVSQNPWMGEYIVDGNSLATEEEGTLTNLLASSDKDFKNTPVVREERLFQNKKVPYLTEAACETLLEHESQFEFGLDFEHLSAGMELKEFQHNGKEVVALDYSRTKARIVKKDPYAINLVSQETLPALSSELMDIWLKLPGTPQSEKLKNQYKALLQREPYNRKLVLQFKQHLPAMLYATEDALTDAEHSILAGQNLTKKRLAGKEALEVHLLYKYLEHFKDEKGKTILKALNERLHLSIGDLNRILAVYTQFGLPGLERLDHVFSKSIKALPDNKTDERLIFSLQENYFSTCQTFLPCLDTAFETALIIIKELDADERYVWDNLFEQHCRTVGFDNLPNLVKAFQEFRATIKKYNLQFPKEPKIGKISSLPVALSRILTILSVTPTVDLPVVWESVFSLNLNSNGAIKVITDPAAKVTRNLLSLPEMQMNPELYAEQHDYCTQNWDAAEKLLDHGYHSLKVTHKEPAALGIFTLDAHPDTGEAINLIHLFALCKGDPDQTKKTPEELFRNYYRYLASKPHRNSIDFYRKVGVMIDKKFKNLTERQVFYGVVANATSSFESKLKDETEAQALERVKKLFEIYKGMKIPSVLPENFATSARLFFFSLITRALYPIPPLEYIENLFFVLQPALSLTTADCFDMENTMQRFTLIDETLDKIQKIMASFVNKYAFYEGVRFLDLKGKSLEDFSKIPDLITELRDCLPYSPKTEVLVSLMSTFKLGEDFINRIKKQEWQNKLNNTSEQLIQSSLKLLGRMKTNTRKSGKALTEQDLENFLDILVKAYKENPGLDVNATSVELVSAHFAEYFEDDFFKKLNSVRLSQEILDLIKDNFATEDQAFVKTTLESFARVEDTFHHRDTVKAIAKICASLPKEEKKNFLEALTTINSNSKSSLQELLDLLILMGERGNVNDFIFTMAHYATLPKRSVNLISSYYKQVLPKLYLKKYGNLKISELQVLAVSLLGQLDLSVFSGIFDEILTILEALSDKFQNEKTLILSILSNFIAQRGEVADPAIYDIVGFIKYIANMALNEDKDVLRSLCQHYLAKPLDLYKFFSSTEFAALDAIKKEQIASMASSLINNGKAFEPAKIEEFISKANASHGKLFTQANKCFATPPYPDLSKLIGWHEEALKPNTDYDSKLKELYADYQKEPCTRELSKGNGFNLEKARTYSEQFKGVDFTEEELTELATITAALREEKDPLKLKNSLSSRDLTPIARIATLAELLYRSKGVEKDETRKIKGNSFELNTVQYLTLLGYLKLGGHITAEMATGEGKSRTMMIALAYQASLGKTVDFVTSDMQLAQRDYLEYQAFFKIIGVETSLIYSTSNHTSYKKQGINFSDASNLSLFRNKARSSRRRKLVIDEDPKNRVLVLDEADKTYFDISDTRFNYSDLPKTSEIKDMAWVYPLLIRFFLQKDPARAKVVADFYKNDIDKCNDAFFDFVKAQKSEDGITEEMIAKLESLPLSQIETWHDSAVIALSLKPGVDYTFAPNVLVDTPSGPKLASEIQIIYGSRLANNSKYSFGVQQCASAKHDEELKDENSPTSLKCKELMQQQGKTGTVLNFHIDPEKQIIYSSTSKTLLDEYKEGDVWGITGTAGSIIEREEAALLYSKEGDANSLMKFFTSPRLNPIQRVDRPIRLTKNFDKRIEAILEYIMEARKDSRPVLVIAETDVEAEAIQKALKKLAGERIPDNAWAPLVDALTTADEEKAIIDEAGKKNMITVSTRRLGRGTDIVLGGQDIKETEEIKTAGGLRVIGTFLPRDRDLDQMFGRAGRYGEPGDARLVVDKEQLKATFKSKSIKPSFFLSTEFFVKSQQAREDKEQQVERLLRQVLSDFRLKVTDAFFAYYDNADVQKSQPDLDLWSKFTTRMDQLWTSETSPELLNILSARKLDMSKVRTCLEAFKTETQKEWSILNSKLGGVLPELEEPVLNSTTAHLIRNMTPKRRYTVSDRTQVYKAYDKALDGRAVIYDELFMEFKATFRTKERKLFANTAAWLAGTGIVFANTRAILIGKRPIFANLRRYIAQSKKEKAAMQVQCKTIISALENFSHKDLKHLLRKEDARALLKPVKGDTLLGFKIQLVEIVLSFMHRKYDNKSKLSRKDMINIKAILDTISQSTNVIDDLPATLKPLRGGFFGHSLKKQLKEAVEDKRAELSVSSTLG